MAGAEKGLEEVLLEIGNRLLGPPSAVDELLPLLDQAETLLSRVEQSPSQSMSAALRPAMKGLIAKELLGHSDVDVKVAVASCISEITRITAPEAPYDDDLMKEIFQTIVESFEKLDEMQNRSYSKRVSILETVAKVRSCVVMLDLECDALILEMFYYFLKTIRDSHPGNVLSSMEMIMTVVLEESEEISPDLLSCLLTTVKKDNKDTFQIARKLAETVIGNCALKLKPCLGEAVQSLGSSLDDFSDIVASVCQADSDQLLHGGLNMSGEFLCLNPQLVDYSLHTVLLICLFISYCWWNRYAQADDSKLSVRTISDELPKGAEKLEPEVACSEGVSNAVGKSSKSIMGNGTVQTENGDSSVERDLPQEKIEDSGHSNLARGTTTSGVEADKVDTGLGASTKEAGDHKSDSATQTLENIAVSRIDGDKETAESLNRSEGSNKEIDNSQAEGAAHKETEAIALKTDAKTTELQPLSEKSSKDEASTISSVPSEKSPETVRPKRGRPSGSKNSSKKGRGNEGLPVSPSGTGKSMVKEHTKNEETPSTDINSKKQNEGISDLEPKAHGQSVKKGPLRNVDNGGNPSAESHSKMDLDVMSDSEGKHLGRMKPQREKAREGEISKKRRASKAKQRTGRRSSEDNVAVDSHLKEKASSVKTDAKTAQDENHVVETPKMKSRTKHVQEKEVSENPQVALKYDESLVGAKIKIWWPDDKQFYSGVVDSYDPFSMRHKVLYVDGDEENLRLEYEIFKFLKGAKEEDDEGDSTPVAASEMSRKRAKTLGSSSKKSKVVASSKGGRGFSTGKGIGSAGKSTGGRRGNRSKTDDSTPTGSRPKEKAGNRSSFGSPKAGSTPKDEASKKLSDASPKTTMKAHDGTPKTGSKANDGMAKKSGKDGKSAAGQTLKGGSTPKSGKSDVNGSAKGKTGPSKRHRDEEAASAGTTKESEERSGKKRRK
ncbi:hypothetical protein Taro_047158 [Colocasia esculenta]|uniref:Uncharacterized protein n=1 Tax=Colocasia esculenta TaxID=4460 RepID=A0A843WVH6_COLES|nr:hypothetical protein [Colocasia esculenta]